MFIFTDCIKNEKPIKVFNNGEMKRDFTYVDDIVSGIYGSINLKMKKLHKVYNLGNSNSESLLEFIKLIEKNLNRKAKNYTSHKMMNGKPWNKSVARLYIIEILFMRSLLHSDK